MRLRSQRGATLGWVAACIILLVILGIGFFLIARMLGAGKEVNNAVDGGAINAAKQALYSPMANVALSPGALAPASQFAGDIDPSGTPSNISLLTYDRCVAQALLVCLNAQAEIAQSGGTNNLAAVDAKLTVQELNQIGAELSANMAPAATTAFLNVAGVNNVRMTGNKTINQLKVANAGSVVQPGYSIANSNANGAGNVGASSNVAFNLNLIPIPPAWLNSSANALKTPDGNGSYTPYLDGYVDFAAVGSPIHSLNLGQSLAAVPTFPQQQPHLTSQQYFTANDPVTHKSPANSYIPPNAFLCSGMVKDTQNGANMAAVAVSVVGALNKTYIGCIPGGYIRIVNGPGADQLLGTLPGGSNLVADGSYDIFNNELGFPSHVQQSNTLDTTKYPPVTVTAQNGASSIVAYSVFEAGNPNPPSPQDTGAGTGTAPTPDPVNGDTSLNGGIPVSDPALTAALNTAYGGPGAVPGFTEPDFNPTGSVLTQMAQWVIYNNSVGGDLYSHDPTKYPPKLAMYGGAYFNSLNVTDRVGNPVTLLGMWQYMHTQPFTMQSVITPPPDSTTGPAQNPPSQVFGIMNLGGAVAGNPDGGGTMNRPADCTAEMYNANMTAADPCWPAIATPTYAGNIPIWELNYYRGNQGTPVQGSGTGYTNIEYEKAVLLYQRLNGAGCALVTTPTQYKSGMKVFAPPTGNGNGGHWTHYAFGSGSEYIPGVGTQPTPINAGVPGSPWAYLNQVAGTPTQGANSVYSSSIPPAVSPPGKFTAGQQAAASEPAQAGGWYKVGQNPENAFRTAGGNPDPATTLGNGTVGDGPYQMPMLNGPLAKGNNSCVQNSMMDIANPMSLALHAAELIPVAMTNNTLMKTVEGALNSGQLQLGTVSYLYWNPTTSNLECATGTYTASGYQLPPGILSSGQPTRFDTAGAPDGLTTNGAGAAVAPIQCMYQFDPVQSMINTDKSQGPSGNRGDADYHLVPFTEWPSPGQASPAMQPSGGWWAAGGENGNGSMATVADPFSTDPGITSGTGYDHAGTTSNMVAQDFAEWTPSSGYNCLLGELKFEQSLTGGGNFCRPN